MKSESQGYLREIYQLKPLSQKSVQKTEVFLHMWWIELDKK